MSAGLSATISGVLFKDPESIYTNQGLRITNFTLPVDVYDSKSKSSETMWVRVACFGAIAERIGDWAQKGTTVFATGSMSVRTYNDRSGEKQFSVELSAKDVILIAGIKKKMDAQPVLQGAPSSVPDFDPNRPF